MIPAWLTSEINKGSAFALTTHVNPDADGVGACVGLAWLLEKLGKRSYIINAERLPPAFRFIEDLYPVYSTPPDGASRAHAWFILDASKRSRTGMDWKDAPALTLNIDHHYDNELHSTHNWVDGAAPATCEMVFRLLRSYGVLPPKAIAEALYAGILIDTGGFKFSNTCESAFAMSAELCQCGVNPHKLYQTVFLNKSFPRFKLEGALLSRAQTLHNGRVCVMEVTDDILNAAGAVESDLEGISNLTVSMKGVDMGLMFIERHGKTKVCFRSDGAINVRDLASVFGGGGHAAAAGCTFEAALPVAREKVLARAETFLKPAVGQG